MKTIALILSLLLLTSCSNPDTSGGVTLSRGGGDWDNNFPNGSCKGPDTFHNQGGGTGCGWVHTSNGQYFIRAGANMFGAPLKWANLNGAALNGANLQSANLNGATLKWANLKNADLSYADLRGTHLNGTDLTNANFYAVKADRWTICPNGHLRGSGGNCGF